MKIPTNSFCPTCKTRLSRDLEAQVLVCEKGHQFGEGRDERLVPVLPDPTPAPERRKGNSKLVGRPLDENGAVELRVERQAPAPTEDWPEEAPEEAKTATETPTEVLGIQPEEKAAPEPPVAQEPTILGVEPPPVLRSDPKEPIETPAKTSLVESLVDEVKRLRKEVAELKAASLTREPARELATPLQIMRLSDGGAVVALALSALAVDHLRCEAEQLNMEWPAFLQQHLQDAIENRGAAF